MPAPMTNAYGAAQSAMEQSMFAQQQHITAYAAGLNSSMGRTVPRSPLETIRERYIEGHMSLGAFEIAVEAVLRSERRT